MFKQFAIFRCGNGERICADHFHVVLSEHTCFFKSHGEVEGGLTAECRQQRVGTFAFDDASEYLDIEWFDVCRVGEIRIGHDRRRIRICEHDSVALFAKDSTCLRS